ncbi:hypothetical protein Hoch_3694 [Haliangium ochraceum DSM 14365]|uniref:Uncharacterized protein n=1 Tax=Haliangium ochraceum (strain DSM 14365 / JCM 11303 / SMP-2) TaxID=502025 RepID=D0LY44_HALO1|nr:hypothetical protein Hoch_3694 [Haliangium ochraceum DSM 14365]
MRRRVSRRKLKNRIQQRKQAGNDKAGNSSSKGQKDSDS